MTSEAGLSKKKAILISLVVGLAIMLLKFWAYFMTHSTAILTDASESIVNIIAASFAYYSLRLAETPKDFDHPYGHGKVEFFSAGLEGVLIIFAGIITLLPAINSFFTQNYEVHNIDLGIIITVIALVINSGLGYFLILKGKNQNSIVLEADGKHLLLDAVSSVAVLFGLVLVHYTGIKIIDPILACVLALFLVFNGYKILRTSVGGLMDETDYLLLNNLINTIKANRKDQWIDVHNFRVKKYGADMHIDCHLTLPYYLSLQESHDEVLNFEKTLRENQNNAVEIFVHTDPCMPECCTYCRVKDCKVRSTEFVKEVIWDSETLINDMKHFEY